MDTSLEKFLLDKLKARKRYIPDSPSISLFDEEFDLVLPSRPRDYVAFWSFLYKLLCKFFGTGARGPIKNDCSAFKVTCRPECHGFTMINFSLTGDILHVNAKG